MLREEWTTALARGDLATFANVLRRTLDAVDNGEAAVIPPPTRDVVRLLGGATSEAALLDLVELLNRRKGFEPPLDERDRVTILVALALSCATPFVAFEIALSLKTASRPQNVLATAIDEIACQGIDGPEQDQRAKDLLTRLFDTDHARRKPMIERLRAWPRRAPFEDWIDYILPQLSPEECTQLQN
jgi:hypothetical protein